MIWPGSSDCKEAVFVNLTAKKQFLSTTCWNKKCGIQALAFSSYVEKSDDVAARSACPFARLWGEDKKNKFCRILTR